MANGKRQHAIFIGYRREDTQDTAGRIYDRLASVFGEGSVFKDVDNLPIGTDFGDHILQLLPNCRVFLALIGPRWLDARDETGKRRLDDASDWVRIELETAFSTPGLAIVPVLINGAHMPRADELPDSLRRLTRLNAAVVRRDPDFSSDMARMVEALRASVNGGALDLSGLGGKTAPAARTNVERSANRRGLVLTAVAIAALGALGYGAWHLLPPLLQQRSSVEQASAALPEMVHIPAGEFLMGSAEDEANRENDEGPEHTVRVAAFELSRTEVTFAQWDACADDGGCNSYRPNDEGWGRGNRPVVNVSWSDAQAYVQWLSRHTGELYRLPTEAEWEYAARAGTTTVYSTGDSISPSQAQFSGTSTKEVASFSANAFGLYDMHGNVWEWVQDCYASSYAELPTDGSAHERNCSYRVFRGGGWYYGPELLRSACRRKDSPADRNTFLGFRVARTL